MLSPSFRRCIGWVNVLTEYFVHMTQYVETKASEREDALCGTQVAGSQKLGMSLEICWAP